jgi:monothiol glutaredoxin
MAKEQLPAALRQRIEETLTNHPTVLFMKGTPSLPQCGFSARVVQLLRQQGVEFFSVNVLADPEIREGIKVFNDWPTIPQLFHKGEFIGGCDIVSDLAARGELKLS